MRLWFEGEEMMTELSFSKTDMQLKFTTLVFVSIESSDTGAGGVSGARGPCGGAEEEVVLQDDVWNGGLEGPDGSGVCSHQRPYCHPVHTGKSR